MSHPIHRLADALRSGDYQQTMTNLRQRTNRGIAYCAAGVYVDLFVRDNPSRFQWDDHGPLPSGYPFPTPVRDAETGFFYMYHPGDPFIRGLTPYQHATLMRAIEENDRGVPFHTIADNLERRLLAEEGSEHDYPDRDDDDDHESEEEA